MTFHARRPARFGRMGSVSVLFAVALGSAMGSAAFAQGVRLTAPIRPALAVIPAEAASADKVALLHGLALIESDVRLALLFARDGAPGGDAAHGTHPIQQTWPAVKDGLIAAGAQDLGPVLEQLAAAKGEQSIRAAGRDALTALFKARAALAATPADIGASVLDLTLGAAEMIDASGTTPADRYQDAWSLLNVARTEADLLMRTGDRALARSAEKIVMALDDVILLMPDPAVGAPVDFDRAVIVQAATRVETLLKGEV